MKVKLSKRTKKNRFSIWLSKKLESWKNFLRTEEGLVVSLPCPHCSETTAPDDLMEFGTLYEFCCDSCGSYFTVTIPVIEIKPGKIEAML